MIRSQVVPEIRFMVGDRKTCLLLVLCLVPYLVNIGTSTLWDINEAFYAEAPREMVAAGDLITPRFNYQVRLEKPILTYWVVLLSYAVFGVNEFAQRLPTAIAALLTIAVVFVFGASLFDETTGLYSATMLATSFKMFWLARRSLIDMLLLLFITSALVFAYKALYDGKAKRLYLSLFYVSMALGTLVKGLVAVIIPTAIISLFLITSRNFSQLKQLSILRGICIYLLIAAPWYVAMYFRHGLEYFKFFFWGQHFQRYLYGSYSLARPIWFYVPTIFAGFFPWSLFLIPALTYQVKQLRTCATDEKNKYLFLGLWFSFVFIFFSVSKGKHEEYMLVLYPVTALMVANFFRSGTTSASASGLKIFLLLTASAFILLTVIYFQLARLLFPDTTIPLIPALIMLLLATALLVILFSGRMETSFQYVAATCGLLTFFFAAILLPQFERFKPLKSFAEEITSEASGDPLVGTYKVSLPSLCFYTKRRTFETFDRTEMENIFHAANRVFCIMHAQDYDQDMVGNNSELFVLDRKQKFSTTKKGFMALLRNGQLDELVLVSNRPRK